MANEYRGYSLFNDVEDKVLQAFNRAAVIFNMNRDRGKDYVRNYSDLLTEKDRLSVMGMIMYIRENGLDTVKREISRGELNEESSSLNPA